MAVADTLRGYRTQFLYTLHRIVNDKRVDCVYLPEGHEDLDVYAEGQLLETIQVKNHSRAVGFSSLVSHGGTTSFFARGNEALKINPEIRLVLVSFGDVDSSLTDKKKLTKNLRQDAILKENAEQIVSHFDIERVKEEELYDRICDGLKQTNICSNPQIEILYLLQWIQGKAERGESIRYDDFLNRLSCFAGFQNKVSSAQVELGKRVRPLFLNASEWDEEALRREFYQGVSVGEKHIQAGLGVERRDKENAIKLAFEKTNVVVVHGMSGQGKSTLCYRLIRNNYPVAFEIVDCDRSSVNAVKSTVESIAAGLQVPVLVYLDVCPSNTEWVSIVNAFEGEKNLRLLVSIREDDWHQHRAKLNSTANFMDLEVDLSENEALRIYDMLDGEGLVGEVNFHEAWEAFSANGALLEFIYYLTHGEKLKDKIQTQWQGLDGAAQKVLSYITIANYLGGRLDEKALSAIENIDSLTIAEEIQRMNGEFFLYDEAGFFKDVHPIRTRLLKEAIFHNKTDRFIDEALKLYLKTEIGDSYLYLLNLIREGLTVEALMSFMADKHLSCQQLYGLLKTLIWQGAADYEKRHFSLLQQLRETIGAAWEYFLPMNFTEIDVRDSLEQLFGKIPNFQKPTELLSRFTPQDEVFCYLKEFLSGTNLDITPKSEDDWKNASQIVYWLKASGLLDSVKVAGRMKIFSKDVNFLATVLHGFKSAGIDVPGLKETEAAFVQALRKKFLLLTFDVRADMIDCTTFIDYAKNTDNLSDNSFTLNHHLVSILYLCRRAFPEKDSFRAVFGRDLLLDTINPPDTEKHISRQNLPLHEMKELRTVVTNLFKRTYQTESSEAYAQSILNKRKEFAALSFEICKAFATLWKKGKAAAKDFDDVHAKAIMLLKRPDTEMPKTESDEFGYGDHEKRSAIDEFHKTQEQFFLQIGTFFRQYMEVECGKQDQLNPSRANLIDSIEMLSDLQEKFRAIFSCYFEETELRALEEQERQSYVLLWLVWDAHNKGANARTTIPEIKERYQRMVSTLVEAKIKFIYDSFDKIYLNGRVVFTNNILNIKVDYSSAEEYVDLISKVLYALYDVFGKYDLFSTQRLILKNQIHRVFIKPVYVSSAGKRYLLEEQLLAYPICRLFEIDVEETTEFPTPDFLPNQFQTQIPSLQSYTELCKYLNTARILCDQLNRMENLAKFDDQTAQTIIREYADRCRVVLCSNSDYTQWTQLEKFTPEPYLIDSLRNIMEEAELFRHILKTHAEWWRATLHFPDFEDLQQQNTYIKIQLIESTDK